MTDRIGLRIAEMVIAECRKVLAQAYEDAGVSGLCDEGRWEVALGSLSQIDLTEIVNRVEKENEGQ